MVGAGREKAAGGKGKEKCRRKGSHRMYLALKRFLARAAPGNGRPLPYHFLETAGGGLEKPPAL